ncbi:hypothetical protein AAFF_G00058770 [Aldrovandia affinis]|uniref:Uncharacterized protein n=1 Tax=Aldrovandia affinis TaxID=143900 RepID=A0AAD7WEB5_9TELE|nr:hypothetical protein AAFF_G00058770 [Aldrovandia affinis]
MRNSPFGPTSMALKGAPHPCGMSNTTFPKGGGTASTTQLRATAIVSGRPRGGTWGTTPPVRSRWDEFVRPTLAWCFARSLWAAAAGSSWLTCRLDFNRLVSVAGSMLDDGGGKTAKSSAGLRRHGDLNSRTNEEAHNALSGGPATPIPPAPHLKTPCHPRHSASALQPETIIIKD